MHTHEFVHDTLHVCKAIKHCKTKKVWISNNVKLRLVLFAQRERLITVKTNSDKIKSLYT